MSIQNDTSVTFWKLFGFVDFSAANMAATRRSLVPWMRVSAPTFFPAIR